MPKRTWGENFKRFWTGEMFPDDDEAQAELPHGEPLTPQASSGSFRAGRCFCGCGSKVSLTARTMNKQGHRTQQLLDGLDVLEARVTAVLNQNPAEDERTKHRLESIITICEPVRHAGNDYLKQCTSATHYGLMPAVVSPVQYKMEWISWRNWAESLVAMGENSDAALLAGAREHDAS
jgi:hypothetical protein